MGKKSDDLSVIKAVLDGIDDVIYVADAETYELLHVNEAFKKSWGSDVLGRKCHQVLQGRKTPCPFCTNDKIFGEYAGRPYIWEFQNEVTQKWYRCVDRAIDWTDGRQVRFELASDITALKQSEQALKEHQITLEQEVKNRTAKLDKALERRQQTEKRLRESEAAIRNKLKAISEPDADVSALGLSDIVDIDMLQPLMEDFNRITGIANAVIDMNGTVLVGAGWQDICTDFHRCHPDTLNNCLESDTTLSSGIPEGTYKAYRCKNNLWDMATPIMLGGRQLGNLFIGQYIQNDTIQDESLFPAQARQYGFDEDAYLAALERVPRVDSRRVDEIMDFFSKFAKMISSMSMNMIQLSRTLTERKRMEKKLRESEALQKQLLQSIDTAVLIIDADTHIIEQANTKALELVGTTEENLIGRSCHTHVCPSARGKCPVTDLKEAVDKSERTLLTSQGNQLSILKSAKRIQIKGKNKILETFIDITDRKLAEKKLQRKSMITAAINRVLREAIRCDTEEAVAQNALRLAEELTGSRFGFIGEVNEQGRFDTIGLSNPGWKDCRMAGADNTLLIKDMAVRGIWSAVLKTGETQIVNDPSAHPDRVGVPEGHPPLTAFLGVPFIRDGRAVGLIALGNKAGGYDEDDREIVGSLAAAFYEVLLRKRLEIQVHEDAVNKSSLAELSRYMAGDPSMKRLCTDIISCLCGQLGAPTGLMYIPDDTGCFTLAGSCAHRPRKDRSYSYGPGEGLVGEVARSKEILILQAVPETYLTIESGLGEMLPQVIYIKPVVKNDRVAAVLELGFIQLPDPRQTRLLETVDESVAAAVQSARSREIQARMLQDSREMTERLKAQQEELQSANEELEEQTQLLSASEARLKQQQEELQAANEELEEKSQYLERNKKEVEQKNRRLETLQKTLTRKAEDLTNASRYKSEFLANMSHELRTPLNSLLLLSKMLSDNREQNLTEDQLESVNVIYKSGSQLLSLINEILDLSKIEAGKMQLHFDTIATADLADGVKMSFRHMAEEKHLDFGVAITPDCPETLVSDRQRVDQVLKNLVSNAVKFTDQGSIMICFTAQKTDGQPPCLAIAIEDTGIGIPEDKQEIIFQAFQQAETGPSRKFGGTGLGLSISRQLASLLGGKISFQSRSGQGSTFTLSLPVEPPPAQNRKTPARPLQTNRTVGSETTVQRPGQKEPPGEMAPPEETVIPDDRDDIGDTDKSILLIEDDIAFGRILMKLCRERGFKCIFTTNGENGLSLAGRFVPKAIVLDIRLPGIDGWAVLDGLKSNPVTRHIPVHFMSVDEPLFDALTRGAIGYLKKPVTREQLDGAMERIESMISNKMKDLLIIEDDDSHRLGIKKLVDGADVRIHEASAGRQAVTLINERRFDCIILDLGLPDMTGFELLEKIQSKPLPPVIVYTGEELSRDQENRLRSCSNAIIIKGVRSEERLLDETSLFLHRVVKDMPEQKKRMITQIHAGGDLLKGRTVMIVDDDMRNVFALSRALSELDIHIIKAENGEKALSLLGPQIDLILMDIMMPVMDGYEAMKKIRADERFSHLPIIALTAKAMKQDRDKCIQAGASDYLSKPVDLERLISMMRIWLYRYTGCDSK